MPTYEERMELKRKQADIRIKLDRTQRRLDVILRRMEEVDERLNKLINEEGSHSTKRRITGLRKLLVKFNNKYNKLKSTESLHKEAYDTYAAAMIGRGRSGRRPNSWIQSLLKARKQLGIRGFVPCKKGTPLYIRAKEIQESFR